MRLATSLQRRAVMGPALVCWLLGTIGCGGGDPNRCDLEGTVTFQGKPVPAGSIVFEPDAAKGNRGPQGFAGISDGRYSTRRAGKPAPLGPVIVRVFGFDGSTAAADSDDRFSPGKRLFRPYTTHFDVSSEVTTFDFDVPASRP